MCRRWLRLVGCMCCLRLMQVGCIHHHRLRRKTVVGLEWGEWCLLRLRVERLVQVEEQIQVVELVQAGLVESLVQCI